MSTEVRAPSHVEVAAASPVVRACENAATWDAFVETFDRVVSHRWAWGRVFGSYGLTTVPLAAYDAAGEIVGVLPLVRQRWMPWGGQLVSVPWLDAAGVLTRDEAAGRALVEEAKRLAPGGLEIRQFEPIAGAAVRTDKVLMELPLPGSADGLWDSLKPKVRNQVRKAEKSGVAVERGGGGLLREFHAVYARNMRDLGSPPQGRRMFETLLDAFPDEARVWIARHEGRPIGGAITLDSGTAVEVPWASSLREANRMCVNHGMYWSILKDAADRGFEAFRFGRSSVGSGTYSFKKQWGAEPVPLYWSYFGTSADGASDGPSKAMELASKIWRKLPVPVSTAVGPHLVSRLS